jgi:hypothetical protein
MDQHKLRSLAGLTRMTYEESKVYEAKKLSDVKAKTDVPEGTFTKKANGIVKTLLKLHDNDKAKAMKALVFYINRAGSGVSNADELEKAKAKLKESIDFDEMNVFRVRAGLKPLVEKKEEEEVEVEVETETDGKGKDGEEEEDDLPSIVKKLAKKAVGKEEEELEELLLKVYQAGYSDGQKDGKDDEEADEDDKKEEKAAKKAEKDAE